VSEKDLQKQAFRWSEQLRKAVNRGDQQDAVDVFTEASSVPGGESLAITAVLLGELVAFVHESGISEFVQDYDPASSSLLDDFAVLGRSEDFFSEVMNYIVDTEADELARATTTLVNMSIVGAQLPSGDLQSSWSSAWWDQIYDFILDGDLEGAVLGTIERGELDENSVHGEADELHDRVLGQPLVARGGSRDSQAGEARGV
jgi:hypothetical protein